jgi:23S rRNA pseudouridine2605 synthase
VLEDGYKTQPAQVRYESTQGKGTWLRVVLREGRKRQIRETGAQLGLPVVRIIRVRIGSLLLGKMGPREWRHLTAEEVEALKSQEKKVGLKTQTDRTKPTGTSSRIKKSGESSRSGRSPLKGRRKQP